IGDRVVAVECIGESSTEAAEDVEEGAIADRAGVFAGGGEGSDSGPGVGYGVELIGDGRSRAADHAAEAVKDAPLDGASLVEHGGGVGSCGGPGARADGCWCEGGCDGEGGGIGGHGGICDGGGGRCAGDGGYLAGVDVALVVGVAGEWCADGV